MDGVLAKTIQLETTPGCVGLSESFRGFDGGESSLTYNCGDLIFVFHR